MRPNVYLVPNLLVPLLQGSDPYIKMPRVWCTKRRRPKESLGMLLEEGFRKTGKLQRDQKANGNFALSKCHA